jgi:hypothetical protein
MLVFSQEAFMFFCSCAEKELPWGVLQADKRKEASVPAELGEKMRGDCGRNQRHRTRFLHVDHCKQAFAQNLTG